MTSDIDQPVSSIQGKLIALLPVVLIVIIALGHVAFGTLSIMPSWNTHKDLQTQIAAGQTTLDDMNQEQGGAQQSLEQQMASWETRRTNVVSTFLSSAEAALILDRLYKYATATGMEIVDLQLQQPEAETTDQTGNDQAAADQPAQDQPYEVQTFQLRAAGSVPQIASFLVLFKEASVPKVILKDMNISPNEAGNTTLEMTIMLYVSPDASGQALADLPEMVLPTPVPTAPPPSPVPTVAVVTAALPQPTMTPVPTVIESAIAQGTYDDTHPALHYIAGVWESIESVKGAGGSYHYSADANATMEFTFVGTSVAIQYVAFKNFGIFEVLVDGAVQQEIDGYAAEGTFGQVVYITGLSSGVHTVTLRNTSRHNEASEGNVIAIDAIQVLEDESLGTTP
jgi:hypothetical protein